ncbi:hypothetical protein [Crassaminicella profunda]|uniref:hypothetical protein n=1 Tax=Crassaminicella profunda TaxID=1286698 RepID=UPI001CA65F54|nr:hypothetical protein [Crassaminicella profunda]QZY56207.1 hypothetical protein K7H06_04240 [Crassaminicella profunda]
MKKIQAFDSVIDDDFYDLMDTVKTFVGLLEELLEKGIITKGQFDEMTAYKRKFINYVDNEIYFEKESIKNGLEEKNL